MKKKINYIKTYILSFLFCIHGYLFAVINKKLCLKGKQQVEALYRDTKKAKVLNDDEYLETILALTHFIASKVPALNNNKLFKCGSIVFEDKQWRLFEFLKGYVTQKVNDIYRERLLAQSGAYARKSTHFNRYYLYTKKAQQALLGVHKLNNDYVHYGIDMPINIGMLPIEDKRHILFGRLGVINNRPLMFIKLEEYGLQGRDALWHTWHLIKHKLSSIPDDLYDYRREDIPPVFLTKFFSLLSHREGGIYNKKEKRAIRKKAKAFGIQEMMRVAQNWLTEKIGSSKWQKRVNTFITHIKRQYPGDWVMRFGNEVILTQKRLLNA